jgi:Phage capsid family
MALSSSPSGDDRPKVRGCDGQAQVTLERRHAGGFAMSTDYELRRSYGDIQSKLSIIDYQLTRLRQTSPDVAPGRRLVASVCGQILRGIAGEDRRAEFFEKAASSPAFTSVPGWAQELCQSTLGSFVLSIVRRSAWAGILSRSPQVSLLGSGVEKVPVSGAAPAASIVIEGAPIPIRKGAFSVVTLTPFKLAAIATFSEELARSSGVEGNIGNLLTQSISAGLDATAFAASGTGSVLVGAASVTASTATPLDVAMKRDLEALLAALDNPSPDVVFVMSPSRVAFASSVLPTGYAYTIAASSALAAATVIAIDPAGAAASLAPEPRIMISEQAALHMDDVPAAIGTAGSPAVVSAPTQSLFQSGILGMRIVAHVAWGVRTGAAATMTSVTW